MILNIFSCASWLSVCFIWRYIYLGLLPISWFACLFYIIVYFILSYMSYLYILDINPLSSVPFENILYSFCCVESFNFNWVSFVYFVFISITLGDRYKNTLVWFMSQSVLLLLFSRRFIVSSLTFRCLIHFEFIFKYGVRECSDSILLHVAIQLSQHHLLKRLFFSPLYFLASFVTD